MLGHPGRAQLFQGVSWYYHAKLHSMIDSFQCDACQGYTVDGHGWGHLAPRDVRTVPREQVDVDLIGPWKITTRTNRTYKFLALTCIDQMTGLAELIRVDRKESAMIADKFAKCWLA